MLYDSSYTTHSAVAGGPVPWAGERPAVDGGDHVEFQAPHVRTNKECLTNTHMYIITQIHILSKHAWHVSSGPSICTQSQIYTQMHLMHGPKHLYGAITQIHTHAWITACMQALHLYTITQIQTHKYTCDHACIGQSICTVAITQI